MIMASLRGNNTRGGGGAKVFSRAFLSFPFAFLCAFLLLFLAVLLGRFVLLPLRLVRLLLLLGVLARLVSLLLLPVQHLLHVGVLEQGCHER